MRQHPPGTIIIAGGEFLRFGGFVNSLLDLHRPPGTVTYIKQTVSIVENLNDCIRQMKGEWVHIQADDHIFDNQLLLNLLERDVDVVVPLIIRRSPPYTPLVFKDYAQGKGWMPFGFDELPTEGLLEVEAAGSGGAVIRKHVLDAIGEPWFQYEAGDKLNEDLYFFRRVREAGFKIYCDVEQVMGHRGMFTIWPYRENGHWGLGLNMGTSSAGKQNTLVVYPDKIKEE